MQECTALYYYTAANRTCITVINIHSESLRSPKMQKQPLAVCMGVTVWKVPTVYSIIGCTSLHNVTFVDVHVRMSAINTLSFS